MYTSNEGVLFVVGGFLIPLIDKRKGCNGFIPRSGAFIVI